MSGIKPNFFNPQNHGNSEFVSLSDYEGTGKIKDLRNAYLLGRFNGTPINLRGSLSRDLINLYSER